MTTYNEIIDRDAVLQMARQAGARQMVSSLTHPKGPVTALKFDLDSNALEAFAKLVAAHTLGNIFKPDWDNYRQGLIDGATAEREACLQIQEDWQYTYANDLVQKIRARGEAT